MHIIKVSSGATRFALSVVILGSLCRPVMAQSSPSPAAMAQSAPAPPVSDREAAIAAVQAFFDTMAAKDVAGAQRILLPDATFHYSQNKDGRPVVQSFTSEWWLKALPQRKSAWFERMWNPEVRIRGFIATVWAPYDFWRNGTFDHCGVDACDVIKTDEGWKISACIYTIETECEPSPLGPPKK
jgi:hypothetical protein